MNDFNRLRLKHHGDPQKLWEILQAECRAKTAKKLPVTLRCQEFVFPSLQIAEMATSDDVAAIHASLIPENSKVLDMTCGLGIDTFHFALKAASVTAVELNHDNYVAACHNKAALGLDNVCVIEGDSINWLSNQSDKHFDVIFIDPARRDASGRHFALKQCQPDVVESLHLLMDRCDRLIIKASPMIDIEGAWRELGVECCETVVIGTRKECKEVVFILSGKYPATDVIRCITIDSPEFSFSKTTERGTSSLSLGEGDMKIIEEPPCGYLYEPYPAVMKGGGMGCLSRVFDLRKFHPNTNLFFSATYIPDFPGEIFAIKNIMPFSKAAVKGFSAQYPKLNVAVRNFPLSAPELAKKLKIKEGGSEMVFGLTATGGNKYLIITDMAQKQA